MFKHIQKFFKNLYKLIPRLNNYQDFIAFLCLLPKYFKLSSRHPMFSLLHILVCISKQYWDFLTSEMLLSCLMIPCDWLIPSPYSNSSNYLKNIFFLLICLNHVLNKAHTWHVVFMALKSILTYGSPSHPLLFSLCHWLEKTILKLSSRMFSIPDWSGCIPVVLFNLLLYLLHFL